MLKLLVILFIIYVVVVALWCLNAISSIGEYEIKKRENDTSDSSINEVKDDNIQDNIVKSSNETDVLCAKCMDVSIGECENLYYKNGYTSIIENGEIIGFVEEL